MKKFDAIILSGGKGTRVKKYTKKIPKCLVDVNGKPFLYHQLKYLKKNNLKKIIISIGYLGKKVEKYLQQNIDFIHTKTIHDGIKPLGTGGATLKALNYLSKNFFIIYGDSYLNFDLKKMIKKKNLATMAIFKNKNKYDKSNIELRKLKKILYFKKNSKKGLKYIDYGVSYVNKQIFKGISRKKFDLSEFYQQISKKNMLEGFVVKKRFYEIGSYKGINDTKKFLANR